MSDNDDAPRPPQPADARSLGAVNQVIAATDEREVPRRRVISWALWDWATQPFNTVVVTFVFVALYLVSDSFLPAEIAALPADAPEKERAIADLSARVGIIGTIAGIVVLVLAPVLGQMSDRTGRKKRWLFVSTSVLALIQFSLFFVFADPVFFWFGAVMVAVGTVFNEIAGVNYNALLVSVSTPRTVGRASGLGWGFGYVGGVIALVIVAVCDTFDWFGMDTSNGLAYRLIAVGCGVWTILFALPIFRHVPEPPARPDARPVNFFAAFGELFRTIADLFRNHRPTALFLLASAIYRDGLTGVFTFGAVLASAAFGFSATEVMIFGIAANLVAGISTVIAGRFDDLFGSRAVIIVALCGLLVGGFGVFFLRDAGALPFWIGGLLLCAFVGPAQASSRSLLARVTPAGMHGEIFGLYATTGRVASFLAPLMWTIFVTAFASVAWGIVGIMIVVALGLVLLLFVKLPPHVRA